MNLLNSRFLIIFVALGIGLLFMIVITISVFNSKGTPERTPLPKPISNSPQNISIVIPNYDVSMQPTLSRYQDIIIGKTTADEIAKLPGLLEKKTLPGGNLEFIFTSTDSLRNNLVETEKNQAVFKRVVSITQGDYQTPNIATYTQAFGKPEFEFTGSNRYGPYFITYVYPSKGFGMIVNPYTSEVYEIQSFKPVSIEEYRNRWGQDINEKLIEQESKDVKI